MHGAAEKWWQVAWEKKTRIWSTTEPAMNLLLPLVPLGVCWLDSRQSWKLIENKTRMSSRRSLHFQLNNQKGDSLMLRGVRKWSIFPSLFTFLPQTSEDPEVMLAWQQRGPEHLKSWRNFPLIWKLWSPGDVPSIAITISCSPAAWTPDLGALWKYTAEQGN